MAHPHDDDTLLRKRIAAIPYWYHRIALPGGIETPGWAPISPDAYGVPQRLDGLRILDVGAWDGYWSFEALRRGAAEVVAIDDFSDHLGEQPSAPTSRNWETFELCREALGYNAARCTCLEMDLYDVGEGELGRFDVVFAFGCIYHLRYPLLALDRLSAVCDQALYVESAILDDFSPYRGGLGHGYPGRQMVMELYPGSQYGNNPTNWWVPTLQCLVSMLEAAGFDEVAGWKLTESPQTLATCRGFAAGKRSP